MITVNMSPKINFYPLQILIHNPNGSISFQLQRQLKLWKHKDIVGLREHFSPLFVLSASLGDRIPRLDLYKKDPYKKLMEAHMYVSHYCRSGRAYLLSFLPF